MIKIQSLVSLLPKIGPKYKELLEKLNIKTIEDLLYHFPFRYEDYSVIKKIKDVESGEVVTIEGLIGDVKNIYTKYGKRLTKGKIIDYTGEIDAVWFNQHYIKESLRKGITYLFSGKVDNFANKLSLISPDFEIKKENNLNTGRLVSVYPETLGVSSKYIRSRINDVVSKETNLVEFIPKEILKKQNLNPIDWCIKQIHFPDSMFEAEVAKERFSFEELFLELLNVEKRKHEWNTKLKGKAFKEFKDEIDTFTRKLPFKLTQDQIKALKDILNDLTKTSPMNRLLEGDVGTGKTIIALMCSYLTYLNGYKTLYMAPTEILAKQHYETFKKYLPDLKINLRTGSNKDGGDFDILIGTHAVLFTKEKYKNIGFIIIDEQHRFGVEQRGRIIDLGNEGFVPHVLSMTATPIPRTLALTIYGDLNISILREHPRKERKVSTKVVPESKREEAYNWIKERNEPTFIVCPLIEESESLMLENVKAAEKEYMYLKKSVFKDIPMGLLHGRMKTKEKEEVIKDFREGRIKILVSTPVIEVGIDIPDATVIVIESAERYGLASLHQLRGRVGRGDKEGFCFVFMSNNSKDAYTRLKNLEIIDTGLDLAEIDMKIRGSGDMFGTMQHGFKSFKIATLDDLDLLERAKQEAQETYPNISKYPMLKEKLEERTGKYIGNN